MQIILMVLGVVAMVACVSFVMQGKKRAVTETAGDKPRVMAKGHYNNVIIPEEKFASAELTFDGKPHIGVFNYTILDVKPKIVFRWFLSLVMAYKDTVGDMMPTNDDVVKMQDFCDLLDKNLKHAEDHQNAVFLGRLTGNGQTQVMWYVNNPELANSYLQNLISSEKYPFDFNFEMYEDENWNEAKYWLKPLRKKVKH